MKKFPAMPECTSCGECCGPVTASPAEVRRIASFVERRGIEWEQHKDDPLQCGFYDRTTKRCRVYSVRPAACRMFGVVQEMPCPFFPEAVRMSLPAKQAIASGLMPLDSRLLAEAFAPDGGAAMVKGVGAMARKAP